MTRAGRPGEAIAFHRNVADMTGRDAMFLPDYANALAIAGDVRAAVAIAGEVLARFRDASHLDHWHADLLWRVDARERALAAARRAVEIDQNEAHRERLTWYQDEMSGAAVGRAARLKQGPTPRRSLIRRLTAHIAGRHRPGTAA